MSDQTGENSKGNVLGLEKTTSNGTPPQLAEEELARVVGGYIGETENLSGHRV